MSIFDMDLTMTILLFFNCGPQARAFSHLSNIFSLTMHMFCQKDKFLKAYKVSDGSVEEDGKGKGMRAVLLKSEGNFWGGDRSFLVALNLILALVAASPAVQVVQEDIFCQRYLPYIQTVQSLERPFEMGYYCGFRAFS